MTQCETSFGYLMYKNNCPENYFSGLSILIKNRFTMKENGYEYVDLGLPSKTMWATCNVGATKPEDSGLLFQFGRVDGYKYDDRKNKFKTIKQNIKDTGNKHITLTASGKTYKTGEILDLDDDAAHVNMGGAWKMPTKDQLEELYDNTTQRVETINGVQCMVFTSNINGHQLFIPFAGFWYDDKFIPAGYIVFVWSFQVHASYIDSAYVLYGYLDRNVSVDNYLRSFAFPVRGVFRK